MKSKDMKSKDMKSKEKHIHGWEFGDENGFVCTYCGLTIKELDEQRNWVLPYEYDDHTFNISIDDLNLPSRIINSLLREGIERPEQLPYNYDKFKEKVLSIRGLGIRAIPFLWDCLEPFRNAYRRQIRERKKYEKLKTTIQ